MIKQTTVLFLSLFALLAGVHIVALKLFLYWKFSWFDIPMHFGGGVVVALGIFTLYDLHLFVPKRYLQLLPIILLVFLVAMIWEVYELFIGVPIEDDYVVDTLTDLGMGLLGAVVGYTVGMFSHKKN